MTVVVWKHREYAGCISRKHDWNQLASTIKGQTGIVAFSRYWTRDGEKSDDASRGILIFGTERAWPSAVRWTRLQ